MNSRVSQVNQPRKTSQALRALFGTISLVLTAGVSAQVAKEKDQSPLEISAGLGFASRPDYQGASKLTTGLVPNLSVSYKTQNWGKISVGGEKGPPGVAWTILDTDEASFGLGLGADTGRTTKAATALRPGSKRLAGMGEIKPTLEANVFGHLTLGVPLFVQLSKGLGDGKLDSKGNVKGHNGTRIEVGVDLPLKLDNNLTLSLSPSITFADKAYTQTFFGVSKAQSASSGFKAYEAKAGVKSAALTTSLKYDFSKNWNATAGVSIEQLQGDAAKSPLVQKKLQTSYFGGVNYSF